MPLPNASNNEPSACIAKLAAAASRRSALPSNRASSERPTSAQTPTRLIADAARPEPKSGASLAIK